MTALSRRSAMLTTAGAITAGLTTRAKGVTTAGEDPVIALHKQYRLLQQQQAPGNREHARLYEILELRYGCLLEGGLEVADAWRRDPIHTRLTEIDESLTELNDQATDVLHELMSTEPKTLAGLRVKLGLLKKQMSDDIEDMDPSESWPFRILNDCLQILDQPTI